MSLKILEREVVDLGVVNVPLEKWKSPLSNILFELDKEDEVLRRMSGRSYIERIIIEEDSLRVDYMIRTNPLDNDWPRLHFYDPKSFVLTGEKIDNFFIPGCSLGKKKQFKREG